MFGPFTGTGAQRAATDAATLAGSESPLVVFVGRREFYAFADHRARDQFFKERPGVEIFEVVDGAMPLRIGIDVDAPADAIEYIPDLRQEIIWVVEAEARRRDVPEEFVAPMAVESIRPDKVSFHIITRWLAADGADGRDFVENVAANLALVSEKMAALVANKLIDSSVVKPGSFMLRLPFAEKQRSNNIAAGTIPGSALTPIDPVSCVATVAAQLTAPTEISPWCLQGNPDAGPIREGLRCLERRRDLSESESDSEITVRSTPQHQEAVANRFKALLTRMDEPEENGLRLSDVYDTTSACPSFETSVVQSFDRNIPAYCPVCDRLHDRIGSVVTSDKDGSLYLRCRQSSKHERCLAAIMAPSAERRAAAVLKAEAAPADKYDEMTPGDFEEVGQTREESDRDGTKPSYNSEAIEDDESSDLYIASTWGTGKSTHNILIIKNLVASMYPRKPKILIVSSRKSLTSQLHGDLAAADIIAHCYDKFKGLLDISVMPISIFQIDSIGRIPSDTLFDIIFVEEMSQLVAHAYQSDVKSGAYPKIANMTSLKLLLRATRRVIVTDNDLTSEHVSSIRALRPDAPYRALKNRFQPWEGMPVELNTGRHARERVVVKLRARVAEQYRLREAGMPWHGTVVSCHSKGLAESLAVELTEICGAEAPLIRLYTSDTDDLVKRADFANATAAWAPEDTQLRPVVVIYTNTISVGVSCSDAHIDEGYSFFDSGNAAAPQSAQMMFRCRKLKRGTVAYTAKAWGKRIPPQNLNTLCDWACRGRNRAKIPDVFRHDRNAAMPDESGATASTPDDLERFVQKNFEGRLWVSNSLESNRSAVTFPTRLKKILERAGIAVSVFDGCDTDAESKAALKLVKEAVTEGISAAADERSVTASINLERAVEIRTAQMLQDIKPHDDHTPRTRDEKLGLRLEGVATRLGVDALVVAASPDAPGWLRYYEHTASGYRNLLNAVNSRVCDPRDYETASAAEATRLAVAALESVGLSIHSNLGTDQRVELSMLSVATNPKIRPVFDDINAHSLRVFANRNGAARAKRGPAKAKVIVNTLNTAIEFFGGALSPVYVTNRERSRKTPNHYKLSWPWEVNLRATDGSSEPPSPRPEHPVAIGTLDASDVFDEHPLPEVVYDDCDETNC
jgi:hypothetical protein